MTTRHVKPARFPRTAQARDTALALVAVVLTPVVEWFDDRIAEPTAKWWNDLKPSERVAAALKASIFLGMLVGALFALTGCRSDEPTIPGHGIESSAVRIAADIDMCTNEMARVLEVSPEGLAAALRRNS
ncbi:MAG: hypothetical protein HOQ21_09960 [Dermatophilaceae bacterium]|nr:hypothetical protein [Dermatophilaceae bacterium]